MAHRFLPMVAVGLILAHSAALAARIELTDGSVLVGDVVSLERGTYTFRTTAGVTVQVPAATVKSISNGGAPSTPSTQVDNSSQLPAPAEKRPPLATPGLMRFAGSNTIGAKLAPALVLDYLKGRGATGSSLTPIVEDEVGIDVKPAVPGVPTRIEIRAHGSATAFQGLKARDTEIGMASRSIQQKEVIDLADLGNMTGVKSEHVLALDGLAVIINPSNPIRSLTKAQIAGIFTGAVKDWSEVGGVAGPITRYRRDDRSGTWDTFKATVLGDTPVAPGTTPLESSEELSQHVATEPGAIGFIGLAYIGKAKALGITECKLSYAPTAFSVKTEEYPLSRRLFLYTPESHPQEVEDFLTYARGDGAQRVVAENGFVDLGIESDTAHIQAPRRNAALPAQGRIEIVDQFLRMTEHASRLSVTFRFRTGSAELDNRAVYDLARLAAFAKSSQGRGHRVMLLGFTDTDGSYDGNIRLSRERAESIKTTLGRNGVQVAETAGFGPEAPVACNDSDAGKNKNRHVEVWIE